MSHCQGNLQVQNEVLMPKHCIQLPYFWPMQMLSIAHQSGYAVLTSAFSALSIVTGCPCSIPTDHLIVFAGIQPAELCQLGATLSLAYLGTLELDHILYDLLNSFCDPHIERLRSRCPFVPAVQKLLNDIAE